jgi:hypothetical protein
VETEVEYKPGAGWKIAAVVFIITALVVAAADVYTMPGSQDSLGRAFEIGVLIAAVASAAGWVRSLFPKKLTLRLVVDDSMVTDPAGLPFIAEHRGEKTLRNRLLGSLIASVGAAFAIFPCLVYMILCFDDLTADTAMIMSALLVVNIGIAILGFRLRNPSKRLIPVDIARSANGYAVTPRQ